MASIMRRLPFAQSATPLQAATYLLGISLFSISFLVFLNSSISFVITDLIGVKHGVGGIVGTLGFVDELVALVACPVWGLVSDRLGVRLVAVIGYAVIALSLVLSVQATNVYPQLLLARILFALGATATATMVTAILPSLTDESTPQRRHSSSSATTSASAAASSPPKTARNNRDSTLSIESQLTITPERFAESQRHAARPARHSYSFSGGGGASRSRGASVSQDTESVGAANSRDNRDNRDNSKPGKLAGFVGLFTGCGALVALSLFLPLPTQFSSLDGFTMADAVACSFYVVAAVALVVAAFVFVGLRHLPGEDDKGWRMLLGWAGEAEGAAPGPVVPHADPADPTDPAAADPQQAGHDELLSIQEILSEGGRSPTWPKTSRQDGDDNDDDDDDTASRSLLWRLRRLARPLRPLYPYWRLLHDSVVLGFRDADIALGYLGGFVARASTVAISLFVPLFVDAYFIDHGFCQGSPHDSSPELKKECRAAYVLAAILTGVAQLMGLLCAPLFGYLSRSGRSSKGASANTTNGRRIPLVIATVLGIAGYLLFALLPSPEFRNEGGRGGSPLVFLAAILIGISQIGVIVCSLGSLGTGVLAADEAEAEADGRVTAEGETDAATSVEAAADAEDTPLLSVSAPPASRARPAASRIRLKGSIAGIYSWCGGAAILLLTKLGGYLFDVWTPAAPFYLMVVFNAVLLVASVAMDVRGALRRVWTL